MCTVYMYKFIFYKRVFNSSFFIVLLGHNPILDCTCDVLPNAIITIAVFELSTVLFTQLFMLPYAGYF